MNLQMEDFVLSDTPCRVSGGGPYGEITALILEQ